MTITKALTKTTDCSLVEPQKWEGGTTKYLGLLHALCFQICSAPLCVHVFNKQTCIRLKGYRIFSRRVGLLRQWSVST